MKIKKYINDAQSSGIASKLLSYSAMAAAFVASGPEATAQCTGETATPGNPVGLDIDGDGTADVQLSATCFDKTLLNSYNYTIPGADFIVGTNTNMMVVTGTASTLTVPLYFGCYVIGGIGGIAVAGSMVDVGPVTAMGTVTSTAVISAFDVFSLIYKSIDRAGCYASVTALGSNQIVGLSATGTGVCGQIDSAPGLAGVGTASMVGYNYTNYVQSSYYLYASFLYNYQSAALTFMANALTTLTGIDCVTNTASQYGGFFNAGDTRMVNVPISATIQPEADFTTFKFITSGFSSYTSMLSSNPITAVAVQFSGPDLDGDGNPDTYNGWITVTYNDDGSVTCTGSGYQQCSIENALATSGNAADACINVGEATSDNPACAIPPTIDCPPNQNACVGEIAPFNLNPSEPGGTYGGTAAAFVTNDILNLAGLPVGSYTLTYAVNGVTSEVCEFTVVAPQGSANAGSLRN